ncbi:hypothetical protein [Paraburkholderia sp. CNPSo 3281]|uniref:Mu transposase domain-containing protein n=1 Tax=Paraburkholderia sp. CNPSo 3281 TaxID=2940933 RepID=UPI0020B87C8C|nr:hypothetical protein [Paraburkholderia sp. CNPSo 3281]MCP3720998.1 hypothetical protein [Paraburkholderia sp. CNPSo 3281]
MATKESSTALTVRAKSAQPASTSLVMHEADTRTHGTTREVPVKRFDDVEQAPLQPLPDVPLELATWTRVKVHPDDHVQFQRADYSVDLPLHPRTPPHT